uniref:Ig-like domain-containing protein n=1 Tax=Periophthalmus magnuspinnatus TaxID=409849 RepID=A0A3B3ZP44_9GOBI
MGLLSFIRQLLVTLLFLASPTLDIPQQWVVLERENHLKCSVSGYYPPPIYLSWTKNGQDIQPPHQIEGEQTADGYYRANGNLTIWPSSDDKNDTFGCKVLHSGVEQQLEFQLNVTCKFQEYMTFELLKIENSLTVWPIWFC